MRRTPLIPLVLGWLFLISFFLTACGTDTDVQPLVLANNSSQNLQVSPAPLTRSATQPPTVAPKPAPTITLAPRPVNNIPAPTAGGLTDSFSAVPVVVTDKDFKTTTSYVYYQINGATPSDLRDQMNRFGPTDSNDRRFDARTDWYINWHYAYEDNDNQCKISSADVEVTVTFTLPKWTPPYNVSPGLVEKWDKYMASLQKHENGHKDNAVSSGQAILQAFKALPSYPNCDQVKQNVSSTGQRIIKQANQKDIDYDSQTRHGATQGATFP